ncbi:MAG: hypothetical protein ABW189_05340 [Rickettsiales bacterium]
MGRAAYPEHKNTIALLRKALDGDAYVYDGELEATIRERAERKFFRGDVRALTIHRTYRTEISVDAALLAKTQGEQKICVVRMPYDVRSGQRGVETAFFQAARPIKPAIWMLHFDGIPPKDARHVDNAWGLTAENAKTRRALSDEEATAWMASRPTDAFLSEARLRRASFPFSLSDETSYVYIAVTGTADVVADAATEALFRKAMAKGAAENERKMSYFSHGLHIMTQEA